MKLNLDFASLDGSVAELGKLAQQALHSAQLTVAAQIGAGYSTVSGLSHMGNNHGQFVSAGVGSAADVLEKFVSHIDWLRANLDSNAKALGLQESTNSRGIELTDNGGASAEETVQSIDRPSANFNGFTFFKPVSLPMDIHSLAASLRASQDNQPVAAGKQWIDLATQIAQVSNGLRSVAAQISSSNEGAVFDAMIPRFEEVASWGDNFAINASQVAADLGRLSLEKLAIQVEAEAVAAQALAINEPQARVAFESYQALMMHEKLQQGLSRAMPTVSNLMSVPTVSTSVQQAIQTGIDALNGNQQVSGNGLGATGQVIGQVANMVTGAGNFGAVDRGVGDVAGVGADGVPTQAASIATAPTTTATGAGSLPNVGGSGVSPAGVGASGSPTSAAGFGGVNSPGVMGAAGAGTNTTGASASSGVGSRAAGMGMVPGMGAAGAAGSGARGATSGVGGSGVGGRVSPGITGGYAGANTASAVGAAGAGRAGMGAVPFAGAAPGAAAGMSSGAAGAGAGTGAGSGMRGGAPMMGGMPIGAQGSQARGKVRRVSSSLEEDRNVKALLGDRGAVVPGVIGAWVRD